MPSTSSPRPTRPRISQRIDEWLLKHPGRLVLALAAAAAAVAFGAALAFLAFGLSPDERSELTPRQAIWEALQRTMDPGQLSNAHGGFGIAALLTTLVGLVLITTLISLVNNQVQQRVDRVKRGREPVRVPDRSAQNVPYYVVLGWSELTLRVLTELAASGTAGSNASQRSIPFVTVMAEESVEFMRDQLSSLKEHDGVVLPSSWQFRTGDPSDKRDLRNICLISEAHSVIVLAPEHTATDALHDSHVPDELSEAGARVVQTLFAIDAASHLQGGEAFEPGAGKDRPKERLTVVVEIPEAAIHADDLARRLEHRFSRHERLNVLAVNGPAVMTQLAAQVSRHGELAAVYQELLDFDGCEFRVKKAPNGWKTFGQAVSQAQNAAVIGLARTSPEDGVVTVDLWPAWDERLMDGNRLVVVAEDDRELKSVVDQRQQCLSGPRAQPERDAEVEPVTVLGWNHRAQMLLAALHSGSNGSAVPVEVFAAQPPPERPEHDGVVWHQIDEGIQRWLDSTSCPEQLHKRHVIVLADDEVAPEVSDAAALLTVQALHPPGRDDGPHTIVAELRRRSSRHLVDHLWADLIVGDALVALMLAQFAVSPEVKDVVDALSSPESGTRIALVDDLCDHADHQTFGEKRQCLACRGYATIGYCIASVENGRTGPVVLNPPPTEPIPEDRRVRFIVVTRDATDATQASIST